MTSHSNTTIALDMHALTRAYRRVMQMQRAQRTGLTPAVPWHLHVFSPATPPPAPTFTVPDYCPVPVAWPTQCRDCWGWVDDPRHLTPLEPW